MTTTSPPPTFLLRSTSSTPGRPGVDEDLETWLRESSGHRLKCRTCGRVITTEAERVEIAGGHVHRRINPAGIEFELGCFGAARGASAVGPSTTEFSWFPGYAWAYSICGRCGSHLGWFFEGKKPRFHGLILNRLELEQDGEEPS